MTVKSAEYKAHKRNALEVSTPDTPVTQRTNQQIIILSVDFFYVTRW